MSAFILWNAEEKSSVVEPEFLLTVVDKGIEASKIMEGQRKAPANAASNRCGAFSAFLTLSRPLRYYFKTFF